ncbi:MAG TPA: LLM class flavin-dependent oxidoreductase [Candidatus Dadabacteria bacterium]|nr:LLM class flavin-dependent oxidoreductase [Candidatus Dadabacteria bacterium]
MKLAITTPIRGCSTEDLKSLASLSEQGGFYGIFSPEVPIYSAISNAQVMAEATKKIKVGTWITNIYMREPIMCAAEALTVQELSEGRMILGLGVSHKPINDIFKIDMGDPYEKTRDYVTKVKSYADGSSSQLIIKRDLIPFDIHIAGLTTKTASLAGELADGIMPYLASRIHLAKLYKSAISAGASKDFELTAGIPVFLSDDVDAALKAARVGIGRQANRPFYKRVLRNSGFEDVVDKIDSGIPAEEALTEELLNEVCLYGKAQDCRKTLDSYYNNGTTLPILTPFNVGPQSPLDMMNQLLQLLD